MTAYITGDVLGARVPILHVCNDVGAWGAGFSGVLSKHTHLPERAYHAWHRGDTQRHTEELGDFALGSIQIVKTQASTFINAVAQRGLRSASNPTPFSAPALASCLARVPFGRIAMPRVGTGYDGASWSDVGPLLSVLDVDVYTLP